MYIANSCDVLKFNLTLFAFLLTANLDEILVKTAFLSVLLQNHTPKSIDAELFGR